MSATSIRRLALTAAALEDTDTEFAAPETPIKVVEVVVEETPQDTDDLDDVDDRDSNTSRGSVRIRSSLPSRITHRCECC